MEDKRYCPKCCYDTLHLLCEDIEDGSKEWICTVCSTPSEHREGE